MDLFNTFKNDVNKAVSSASSFLDRSSSSVGYPASAPTAKILPEYMCTIKCADLGITVQAALPPEFDWALGAEYDTPYREAISGLIDKAGDTASTLARGVAQSRGLSLVTQALTAKVWAGSSTGDIVLPLVFQAETDEISEVIKPVLALSSLVSPRSDVNGGLLRAPGPRMDLVKAAASVLDLGVDSLLGSTPGTMVVAGQEQKTDVTTTTDQSGVFTRMSGMLDTGISKVDESLATLNNQAMKSVTNQISIMIGNYMFFESVVIKDVSQKHYVQPVGTSYGKSTGNMQRVEVSVAFAPFVDLTINDIRRIYVSGGSASQPR